MGERGRRAGLSPEVLAKAALDLVDDEGLDALSMRALARRLGVTPMALYNHVTDKDDLLARMTDLVAGEMAAATPPGPWREQVEEVAHAMRATHLAHPAAITLLLTADSVTEASLRPVEAALDGFTRAGLDAGGSRAAWIGLVGLVTGHAAYELRGHLVRPVDPTDLPHGFDRLRDVVACGPADHDTAFTTALGWYLDGIEHSVRG